MGILTEATVRISPRPEREGFHALFFPDWERARTAVRELAQSGAAPVHAAPEHARGDGHEPGACPATRAWCGCCPERSPVGRGLREGCMLVLGVSAEPPRRGVRRARRPGPRGAGTAGCACPCWAEVARGPLPRPLPAQRRLGARLGAWTPWRRPPPGATCPACSPPSRTPARSPRGPGRAGTRLHPPVTRLRHRLQPVHDVHLPVGEECRRDPCTLARAQDRGQPRHGRPRRHHQPSARRRHGPPALVGSGEGRSSASPPSASSWEPSIQRACSTQASSSDKQ